jgi:hypothetical protein
MVIVAQARFRRDDVIACWRWAWWGSSDADAGPMTKGGGATGSWRKAHAFGTEGTESEGVFVGFFLRGERLDFWYFVYCLLFYFFSGLELGFCIAVKVSSTHGSSGQPNPSASFELRVPADAFGGLKPSRWKVI